MSGKSFEEKLKEREAAIRQKWAAQLKGCNRDCGICVPEM